MSYCTPEVRDDAWEELAAGKSYPTLEARGSGWEEQPYVQGEVAARAQEGLEALSHVEGQEGWR